MTMAAEIKARMATQPAMAAGGKGNTVQPGKGRPVNAGNSGCCGN